MRALTFLCVKLQFDIMTLIVSMQRAQSSCLNRVSEMSVFVFLLHLFFMKDVLELTEILTYIEFY